MSVATPAEQATVIHPDGRRLSAELSSIRQIELYVRIVHTGAEGLVEVVRARRLRDGRLGRFERRSRDRFHNAGDASQLAARASRLLDAERGELFVTPSALAEPRARNQAVSEAICAWVDLDNPDGLDPLRAFPHLPHLVIASGSGGRHAYWRLAQPAGREQIARANRMLTDRLGGDRQSANPARLMRLPGSLNWKSGQPVACRILFADLRSPGHQLARLLQGLRDPKQPRRRRRSAASTEGRRERALEAVPPPAYFWAIARIEVPEGGGHVRCPHADHPDRHPSAYVYPEPGQGWHCFSCSAGGGPVQLVAALRGLETSGLRGKTYLSCRAEALRSLGIEKS
jgi:hypothetical protein